MLRCHRISRGENAILEVLEIIMATLADLQAAVAAQHSVEESAITLLGQLHEQLSAALASEDTNAIQALVDQLGQDKDALASAVAANTPAVAPAVDGATTAS